jgi:diaminopimelate dehydrogenase
MEFFLCFDGWQGVHQKKMTSVQKKAYQNGENRLKFWKFASNVKIKTQAMKKTQFAIVGYGNLGKGVVLAASQNPDMELVGIFTRRAPESIKADYPVYSMADLPKFKGKLDVVVLCGGSATDLPEQTAEVARLFNTVDSFDTHAAIPEYFEKIDGVNKSSKTLSLISTGWDPGLFSIARILGESVLPEGKTYTFWGKGVSQGHSDAIRRVKGVKNGIQYTIPKEEALRQIREGNEPELSTADKHFRVCYVVADENADKKAIEAEIKNMPNYFADYETTVHFIDEETLKRDHAKMPHGGVVVRSGKSGSGLKQRIEFSLSLDSNPEFTSSVIIAYARAIARMAKEGQTGCKTVFDIPLGYLSSKDAATLRKELL